MTNNIDDEWNKFIASNGQYNYDNNDDNDDISVDEAEDDYELIDNDITINLDSKSSSLKTKKKFHEGYDDNFQSQDLDMTNVERPIASKIYISTKTKLAYLNNQIDLKEVFWSIPILSYAYPMNGVIKKQMKFNSLEPSELEYIKHKLSFTNHFEEHVITSINNPNGRIKFKDIRKISIGLSKKDIMSYRCKKKSAFYNCFVLIMRIKVDGEYKEFHVKVFNTGKVEIPGIQTEEVFQMILELLLVTIQPHVSFSLGYKENSEETVLINSNFNCGFYINREILYDTLRMKYNIQAILDPCSYPGIQCKFYYNPEVEVQTGCQVSRSTNKNVKAVSFMIFRTGSVLIVGRCDENVIISVYEYLKNILYNEFHHICQKNINLNGDVDFTAFQMKDKEKVKKIRRKNILNSEQVDFIETIL